jgi:hypothetical protein
MPITTFTVQATVATIVNYNLNMIIVQATGFIKNFFLNLVFTGYILKSIVLFHLKFSLKNPTQKVIQSCAVC